MGGSITPEELYSLSQRFPIFQKLLVFIETGTYHGDTTRAAALYFQDVFTFEIHPGLFAQSKAMSERMRLSQCHHLQGDSVKLMGEVLEKEKRPAMFFLDAHQSGPDTSNNHSPFTPLMDELAIINAQYPKGQPALICVDDVRLWRAKYNDWSIVTDEKIIASLSNHTISESVEMNDRFFLVLNGK